MDRLDIAIIGTGPAGISAAITAKARSKNIMLLGSRELSTKIGKAHTILNYPGLPECSGEQMADAFAKHLAAMDIAITEERITAVYAMGDYFALQSSTNQMYEATTVILATGMIAAKPYPGETEMLGRGVSYCATCDAPLYRGKTVAVIGETPKEESEVDYLAGVCGKVYYFPMYKGETHVAGQVEVIREKPAEITGGMKVSALKTAENSYDIDCVFILRESVAPGQLVPGLAMDGNHVSVDRNMATAIPGCFACGDIVGKPYQYIKSAGEGNVAALSAVAYIDALRRAEK